MDSKQLHSRILEDVAPHSTYRDSTHGNHAQPDFNDDEDVLRCLGYKQEFKRDFSMWTCLGVSFSILGILPSVASTLTYNLAFSGPAGSLWMWIAAGIPIQFIALSIAELCSSMPTAGGLYYASAVLAPEGWGPFAAWVTGWSNFIGWAMVPCAINYVLASMILTAVTIANPTFTMQTYQIYLAMLCLLTIEGFITMNSTKILAQFNALSSIVNAVVLIIFIFWMPFGSINTPKTNPSRMVWTSDGIVNGTEWPIGFACMMGMLSVIATIAGFDAPFHLSEECSNANIAAPRAIVMTAQLGLWIGWAVIIVVAYTVVNVTDVVSGQYGQPMGSLCLQVLGPKAGLGMFCLNIFAQFLTAQGCIIGASRVTFSFSRDDALPFARWTKKVNRHTKTPVNAIWVFVIISAIVGLLMFASQVAIFATFSIGVVAQYIAFGIPITLRMFAGDRFQPGPWHLGKFSKPINIVAVCWILIIVPILCFPAVKGKDLTPLFMNWACLVYGGVMALALLWYVVDAHKWFKGPKVNLEDSSSGNLAEEASESHDMGEVKKVV